MVQIPKPDVVLVSSDIFVNESENLLDIQWDVTVLDARCIAKGGIARLANATAQTKCPHFIISGHVPTSELGLVNTLKVIDAKQAVRLDPVSCGKDRHVVWQSLLESHGSHEEGEREEHMVEHLQSLIKIRVHEMGSPTRPIPHQSYREILIRLDFKPEQRSQYKESLVRYYEFLRDEGLHRWVEWIDHLCRGH